MTRLFIVGHHFAPARLSASGYAEFHPTTSNATADGRAQNRRVDIIVLPRVTIPQTPAIDVSHTKLAAVAAALPSSVATTEAAVKPLPSASR